MGFFPAGLVVLGGMQQWWLQPLLLSPIRCISAPLAPTAITDNAALTYLVVRADTGVQIHAGRRVPSLVAASR